MIVVLVHPPACDPTAPYLAVPVLTGVLRAHGVGVIPIDANIEAFDDLLSRARLTREKKRLEERLAVLDAKSSLSHTEQLEYAALTHARGEAHAVPSGIETAKKILRDEVQFFDPDAYASAVATIDAALRVVSATHHPLHLDFTSYRTPFGLTTLEDIDAGPFEAYLTDSLIPRLRAEKVTVVGISVCFPGQLQPAYAFARAIKRALPDVHVTCGGPVVTQTLLRLSGKRLEYALGAFDSACLFEGEQTLVALVRALEAGTSLREISNVVVRDRLMGARWVSGHGMEDLKALPSPDFTGMPLDRYLSPHLVLPYDPTRGCYWGKCTFCHYGLAEVGTAAYRERDVSHVIDHLRALSAKHQTRYFYFSQDSVAPKTLVKLARAIVDDKLDIKWATDLKPEKYMTRERAELLAEAGAVACALGVESGSARVLRLIDKGAPPEVVSDVIDRLAGAGIAAEAMCFTEFPTESHAEAKETFAFLGDRRDKVAVYIVGEFGLTHGSLVAQDPTRFEIKETWELEGDPLGLGIFFAPARTWKTDDEREDESAELAELSRSWILRSYPWAGAVSTAHTILYYDRFGPSVFRDLAARGTNESVIGAKPFEASLRFDPARCARASAHDGAIFARLVNDARKISEQAYSVEAKKLSRLRPRPSTIVFDANASPRRTDGRRPSHAPNLSLLHRNE